MQSVGDFRTGMSGECMSIVYKKTGILPKHIFVNPSDGGGFTKYIPERTCTRGSKFWECSECGHEALVSAYNYCPFCGARVEGE